MCAMTLNEFAEEAAHICRRVEAVDRPRRVAPVLEAMLSNGWLLDDAARACPPNGYGRNPIHIDPDGLFSVLCMVWPAGIATPIHDHKVWCALGVYEGVMEQRHYKPADPTGGCDDCHVCDVERLAAGAVCHLPVNDVNIHSMHNPTDRAVISIHVYGGNTHAVGPNLLRVYRA
ncbi:MAG: hypothetical protein FJX67_11940 [Alphaproteobacteria bacterium]|nr:hypothetical protein [Alphaproteobacteria bacterium]